MAFAAAKPGLEGTPDWVTQRKYEELKARVSQWKTKCQLAKEEIQILNSTNQELQTNLESVTRAKDELMQTNRCAWEKLRKANEKNSELHQKMAESSSRLQEAEEALKMFRGEVDAIRSDATHATDAQKNEVREWREVAEAAEARITDLTALCEQARQRNVQLERKLRILNEQNYSIVNRHKLELQHAADAHEAELAQHTAALQAKMQIKQEESQQSLAEAQDHTKEVSMEIGRKEHIIEMLRLELHKYKIDLKERTEQLEVVEKGWIEERRNLCDILERQTARVGELEDKLRCAAIGAEAAESARERLYEQMQAESAQHATAATHTTVVERKLREEQAKITELQGLLEASRKENLLLRAKPKRSQEQVDNVSFTSGHARRWRCVQPCETEKDVLGQFDSWNSISQDLPQCWQQVEDNCALLRQFLGNEETR